MQLLRLRDSNIYCSCIQLDISHFQAAAGSCQMYPCVCAHLGVFREHVSVSLGLCLPMLQGDFIFDMRWDNVQQLWWKTGILPCCSFIYGGRCPKYNSAEKWDELSPALVSYMSPQILVIGEKDFAGTGTAVFCKWDVHQ